MAKAPRKIIDWEAVEREYRAGQLSIREISRAFGLSDTAIHKRAKIEGWKRPLAALVRKAIREKLALNDSLQQDGLQVGLQNQRATDKEIVENASNRGFEVVTSHRRDIEQLHALKRIIATRLATYLQGGEPDGAFMGDKESPGDLIEKLSRVTSRLIPLERQAYSLDADLVGQNEDAESGPSAVEQITRRLASLAAGERAERDSSVALESAS